MRINRGCYMEMSLNEHYTKDLHLMEADVQVAALSLVTYYDNYSMISMKYLNEDSNIRCHDS